MKYLTLLLLFASCTTPQPNLPSVTGFVEAMHGPYHGCLQWFFGETGAWRTRDPQRGDTASADEYTPGVVISTHWVCDIEPRFLFYDYDSDFDVDLRDYALYQNSLGSEERDDE